MQRIEDYPGQSYYWKHSPNIKRAEQKFYADNSTERKMVRAKFKVNQIEAALSGQEEMRTIVLSPVYSNNPDHENSKFFKYTPSGSIRLGTINSSVWPEFELGQEYYVDFTAAKSA